jgi:beta propeller repeat protein
MSLGRALTIGLAVTLLVGAIGLVAAAFLINRVLSARYGDDNYDLSVQPAVAVSLVSPGPNKQESPTIDGQSVVWSEFIDGYWQIVHFDLATGLRRQLTNGPYDHVNPSIAAGWVVWWWGEPGGASWMGGWDLTQNNPLELPTARVIHPSVSAAGVMWVDPDDALTPDGFPTLDGTVIYYDRTSGTTLALAHMRAANAPVGAGEYVVWQAMLGEDLDIYAIALGDTEPLSIAVADGDQTAPDTDGHTIVWSASREPTRLQTNPSGDIHGYDLDSQRELVLSVRNGDETGAKVSGDWVVWQVWLGDRVSVYAYNMMSEALVPLATGAGEGNGFPDISGNTVVWVQSTPWQDRSAISQIAMATLPVVQP